MQKRRSRIPQYCLHKPSGQARVIINGDHIYLGKYGTAESEEKYRRLIATWMTSGSSRTTSGPNLKTSPDVTVTELVATYWRYAQGYYVKDGKPTGEIEPLKAALRVLRELYGSTPSKSFGPLALRALQEHLVQKNLSRTYINGLVRRIKAVFKWAVSRELVPPGVYQALATVPGLTKGRTAARETDPALPVSDEVFEATLPHLPLVVRDIVKFHRLTGGRPSEILSIRPADVDRSVNPWKYIPGRHKVEHHGRGRVIFVGPQAQQILLPYLLRDPERYCFSPAESEQKRKAELRAKRRTKVQPSQRNRRKKNPKRRPGDRYSRASYRWAILRACDAADKKAHQENPGVAENVRIVPRWAPNQLRHSLATELRAKFGIEATQTVLGHAKADVTQVYAERDMATA